MKRFQFISRNIFFIACFIAFFTGCKKQDDFLDEKRNISAVIPATTTDFQTLLNNEQVFNTNAPSLGALTAEDYTVSNAGWLSATANERNAYTFASDIYQGAAVYNDWSAPYNAVYVANTVLEGLNKLNPASGNAVTEINRVKGQALFYRSWIFYNLLQTFAMPYDSLTAGSDPGIPLWLTADFNAKTGRSSVKDCYDQIIGDLTTCLSLLPETSDYKTRPSLVTVNAALARIYLAMGKYNLALQFANATLNKYNTLLDFNTLTGSSFPIAKSFLPEDIFHQTLVTYGFIFYSGASIDSTLFASYDSNDLRKTVYFVKTSNGYTSFKGTYDYKGYTYCGLATDEIYLIRAECYARAGNVTEALNDLNTLLASRWKTRSFIPYTASSPEDALLKILAERRKELIFRGLRWTDLRRLNKEDRFKVTLTRTINGTTYSLPPNDLRYAILIPPSEIQLSGIEQNKR